MLKQVYYELEDILRFLAEENITDVYVESVLDLWVLSKLDISDTFAVLSEFSKKHEDKLGVFYDVKCPQCGERLQVYEDTIHIGIGSTTCCEYCNTTFTKDTDNIYLFFRISNEWAKSIRDFNKLKKVRIRRLYSI